MSEAIYARRAQRTDRESLPQTITVHEGLNRGFVGTIVTCGPERVGLVERPVRQNFLMHGARGYEDKSPNPSFPGGLNQTQRPQNIGLDEAQEIPFRASKAS
jgi:hypothetical protein